MKSEGGEQCPLGWTFVCGRLVYGDVFSEEFSVPECLSARSVNSDEILVKLPYFDDDASSVPFVWVLAGLVLDPHSVTYF